MPQVYFDTPEFVETLEKAGMPTKQAKAVSIAVKKSHEVAEVATKSDITELRTELKTDINELRNEMNYKFEKISLQLTVRLGGMLIVAVAALAAMLKIG